MIQILADSGTTSFIDVIRELTVRTDGLFIVHSRSESFIDQFIFFDSPRKHFLNNLSLFTQLTIEKYYFNIATSTFSNCGFLRHLTKGSTINSVRIEEVSILIERVPYGRAF